MQSSHMMAYAVDAKISLWNDGKGSTWSYTHIGMTSMSDLATSAR